MALTIKRFDAWVNDDYGDGGISDSLYARIARTKEIAVQTRKLGWEIGSYSEHLFARRTLKIHLEVVSRANG